MKTEMLSVDAATPSPEVIARAAAILRNGGLVAFPTETVYGLGANALDATAVTRIFAAKGRPANNPLIVHVAHSPQVSRIAAAWPDLAVRLAERFWPGPLTLVLPKQATVPDSVTAGGPTIAVRVPAHPVALALLQAANIPVAAPSANLSSELSPTRAEHVRRGLDGRIDMILDAGPTTGGIESTVLDLTSTPPQLLRPGLIRLAELEEVIGPVSRNAAPVKNPDAALASPGMLPRHYAPRTKLYFEENNALEQVKKMVDCGCRVGWIPFASILDPTPGVVEVQLPRHPTGYAANIYAALHELDNAGLDVIVIEAPPSVDEWLAVRDRLQRAAWQPA